MATKKNVSAPVVAPEVVSLEVGLICPNPKNPRKRLGDVKELAASIEAQGIRQNLLVVPHPEISGQYLLVIGHRRLAAAKLAGLTHVPAVIDGSLSVSDQLLLMGVENVHRSDLTISEEADWLQGLLDLGEISKTALPKATGLSRRVVQTRLTVAHMPDDTKKAIDGGVITLDDLNTVEAARDIMTDEEYVRAIQALGSPNDHWQVRSIIQSAKYRGSRLALAEKFRAAGFEVIEDRDVLKGKNAQYVSMTYRTKPAPGHILLLPNYGGHLEIYSLEEAAEDPAVVAAREEENRATAQRWTELNVATETRHEWVLALTRGTVVPAKPREMAGMVREYFVGMILRSFTPARDVVAAWLFPDADGLEDEEIYLRILDSLTRVGDFRWMLAMIAATVEHARPGVRSDEYCSPSRYVKPGTTWGDFVSKYYRKYWTLITDWCDLLDALGYEMTPYESEQLEGLRQALNPPADAEDVES